MIHYHGGPITPDSAAIAAWRRGHAMISFSYPEQLPMAAENAQSFTLDNGAFTEWKNSKKPDWNTYADWIRLWCRHPGFDWCLIPDIIDGTEEENTDLIEWWGKLDIGETGIPVWHLHESLEKLGWLRDEYPRIALGSSGDFSTPGSDRWWMRMAEVMDVVCDEAGRPLCKLHGLRMLNPTIFSHLPLASADSTNVAQNVGKDKKWKGPYPPMTKAQKAMTMTDRIEFHASASWWNRATCGVQENLGLIG